MHTPEAAVQGGTRKTKRQSGGRWGVHKEGRNDRLTCPHKEEEEEKVQNW